MVATNPSACPPAADAVAARPRRRPDPELEAVWRAYKATGDPALRNRLVEAYHYLVKVIGNRVAARLPRSVDVQDLRSAGVFGLMRAIDNFDLDRGTPFESYCATRVRGAILDELRAQDWVPRLVRNRAVAYERAVEGLRRRNGREPAVHEVARELDLPLAEANRMRRESHLTSVFTLHQPDEDEEDSRALQRLDALMDRRSEAPFEQLVLRDVAQAALATLKESERTVIALYYQEGLTMKEIGRVLGISESRVCQIHTRTLERLRTTIEALGQRPSERPQPTGRRRAE